MGKDQTSLYAEVTQRVIAELEAGRLPWVQPWDNSKAATGLPSNAGTGRHYSGVNVLILWAALSEKGYGTQRWLTYRQAQGLGGQVRRGEQGTTICYSDRFIPQDEQAKADERGREAKRVAFLRRHTVFNVEQCVGLPLEWTTDRNPVEIEPMIPRARYLIAATGALFFIGGDTAFYAPEPDIIHVPPPSVFHDNVDWYRTVFHELGHWTGHRSRLDRLRNVTVAPAYAREELCAELASAFLCAELGIAPTVRHADYIGAWLAVLHEDYRALFRAASRASKAADYILAFEQDGEVLS